MQPAQKQATPVIDNSYHDKHKHPICEHWRLKIFYIGTHSPLIYVNEIDGPGKCIRYSRGTGAAIAGSEIWRSVL